MIRRHRDDILNYFKILINNGAVDTLKNKVKAIQSPDGFRTAGTFKPALYHGMGKLPEPQLTHKFV